MLVDIHNHTTWSDGDNTVNELVDRAASYNLQAIGISDHYEMLSGLDTYRQSILEAQKNYKTITVLAGTEIRIATLLSLIPDEIEMLNSLDYILIEHLEYQTNIPRTLKRLDAILASLKCGVGMAHLDIGKLGQHRNLVLDFIKEHQVFLDFNIESFFYQNVLSGFDNITDVLNRNIVIGIGSDTHSMDSNWNARLMVAHKYLKKISAISLEHRP